ncbi:MAG TPA: GspH/FimT family pseudopilin [Methylomirabilota bacterium]|jgi:type IV fimbrial biogenesis protein FimT|nr:GspH/FimT family pseudopilin [Methylomirabilota bacterium]
MAHRGARGVTLVELALVLAITTLGIGLAAPAVGRSLDSFRVAAATQDLYGAIHLTRAHARWRGVMHALVIERDGRTFRIVEDPTRSPRTVFGPQPLGDGVVASGNSTIRFSPKGFAVPFGTITVRAGDETRRLVVNLLGRVRVDTTSPRH